MKPKYYLKSIIETIPVYTLTNDDRKCIQFEGVEEYIYKKLTSSKYRSSAIAESLEITIRSEIEYCIKNSLPIHIVLPFGAYKRPHLPTSPSVDFAELFNMILMREYLAPIIAGYKKGAIMDYYSVAIFTGRINHISQESLDTYDKDFQKLIKEFSKYCPSNLEFRYSHLSDVISQENAWKSVDIKRLEVDKLWDTYTQEQKDILIKRAKVSCNINESDPNYEKDLMESILDHEAFSTRCWDNNGKIVWRNAPDMVTVGQSYTGSWALHLKSSATSRVNYWVGIGALMKQGESYVPTILSYDQFLENKEIINIKEAEISNMNLPNLKSIPIISN
jgi:hypothetical protein